MTRDELLDRIDVISLPYLFDLLGRLSGYPAMDGRAFGMYLIDQYGEETVMEAMKAEGIKLDFA